MQTISNPKIAIYAHPSMKHQVDRAKSFQAGMRRHGYNVSVTYYGNVVDCDLAVFWGMHQSKQIRAIQESKGRPWLMMERGYVGDRFHWTSIGYNGLNGNADFLNEDSLGYRWEKYFHEYMQPWNVGGEYVLVAAQVMGDASLVDYGGRPNYEQIIEHAKKFTKRPIHFRPHPQRPIACPPNAIPSPHKELSKAIEGAWCVLTINSNTSVDAVLAGKPCITLHRGSMAREVTAHGVAKIELPFTPDRTQWAYNLAYTQWSPQEIENGEAWNHLKRKFE